MSLSRSIQKTWRTSVSFWPQLVCQQTKSSSSLLLLFMSQPGSKSVFSKVILPDRRFIPYSSSAVPQRSWAPPRVSSRLSSQSPQLGYGTVRSGLCPGSRPVRFRCSRSLDAHAERRTSECTSLCTCFKSKNRPLKQKHPFNVLFIDSSGLHRLPVWWAAPLREGKPVYIPAAVDFTRNSPGSPALHPPLLGRCGCKKPGKHPPLQPVRGGGKCCFRAINGGLTICRFCSNEVLKHVPMYNKYIFYWRWFRMQAKNIKIFTRLL